MNTHSFLAALLTLVLIGTSPAQSPTGAKSAKPGSATPAKATAPAVPATPPVIWKSSGRTLTNATTIELRFPTPMIGEAQAGQELDEGSAPVVVTPSLKGRWIWRSASSGVFTPTEEPQRSQTYTVAVRGDVVDLAGNRLAGAQPVLTLRAAGLLLVQQYPTWFSYANTGRSPQVILQFNDKVDLASAARELRFVNKAGLEQKAKVRVAAYSDLPRGYEIPPVFRQRALALADQAGAAAAPAPDLQLPGTLVITPDQPLPVGEEWNLRVAGVSVANSQARMEDPQSVRIGDVQALKISSASANNEIDGPKTITLWFNKTLAEGTDPGEVIRRVKVNPPTEHAAVKFADGLITITGDFAHETAYRVEVGGGLQSDDGLAMTEGYAGEFQFKMIAPVVALPALSASQLAKGRAVFDVHTVNIGKVTVRAKAADRDSLIYALRAYAHYTDSPEEVAPSAPTAEEDEGGGGYTRIPFDTMPGRKVFEQSFESPAGLDQQDEIAIDWKQALAGQTAGALFVTVEGEAKPEWAGTKRQFGAQAFVQLTDLGLAWKLTAEEAFVMVFSQSTGKPMGDVTLTAIDVENHPLATARTAADGTARLPRKQARWLMAEAVGDLHAIELDSDSEGLGMWRFGVPYQWNPPAGASRSVTLFTERPIYLPGQTVFFKAVSRRIDVDGVKLPPASEKAALNAYDAKGRLFHQREVTLVNGSCDGALELPVGVLGNYHLDLVFEPLQGGAPKPAEDEDADPDSPRPEAFNCYFLVEEYKANTFQIAFDEKSFKLDGEKAALSVQAKYLLGKPLSKARLTWTANVGRSGFGSEAFDRFNFLDTRQTYYWDADGYHEVPDAAEDHEIVTAQVRTDLSDKGRADLAFTVPAAPFARMPRAVTVTAEVTDLNQQTITERWSKTLHSSDFYLGIGALDAVSGAGTPVAISLVAAKNDGQPWPQPVDASLKVEKLTFTSVRVQTVGGGSNVKSEAQRSVVAEGMVRILPKGQDTPAFEWTPKEPGFYYVTARASDAQGLAVESVTSLQVYGESWATWEERDGVKIDLAPDKTSYGNGETARILVKSPVVGRALVTVERRNVISHFFTEIKSNAQAIEVPVDASMAPNVYVSVFIIRGADGNPRTHKSPDYKFGLCEIKVADPRSQLKLEVASGKPAYQPGDEGSASVIVTDGNGQPVAGAEVTLWAADDGVLTLRNFSAPDLWTEFHQPQPLAVLTGTSLMSLLAENPRELEFTNKGYVIGGGGSLEALGEKMRKNFQPVAFWKGALTTDAAGRVSVTFTVPDNLTRFRLVAVAASGADRFGSAEGAFEISKPLMLEPALPRFANVGDQVTVKGVVLNNTDQAFEAEVSLELDGRASGGPNLKRTIALAAHEAKAVAYPLTLVEPGAAVWKWRVASVTPGVGLADTVQSTLAIGFAQPELHDLQYAVVSGATADTNLLAAINPELLEGKGELTVTLSNSTLAETSGALAYLLHYPYGCVEQTTSSVIPWLALRSLGDALPGVKRTPAEIQNAIQRGAGRLLSMQTADGGLAYWPGGGRSELWASGYGGMGLVMCRDAGAVVPGHRLDQLAAYLSASLRNTAAVTASGDLFDRAFACYTLALLGKAEPAYHELLAQKIKRLPHPGRALLALAILNSGGNRDQALKVLDDALDPDLESWNGNIFDSRLTALNLLVWIRLEPQNVVTLKLTERLLRERSPRGDWGSTYENAWAVLALAAETTAGGKVLNPVDVTVTFAGRQEKLSFPAQPATRSVVFPIAGLPGERELTVTGVADGLLRSAVAVTARPKLLPVKPRTVGFGITRQYQKLSPNGVLSAADALEIGDLVAVTLDLDIPRRSRYLAVDDPLPSIFEAVNSKLKSQVPTTAAAPGSPAPPALTWWSSFEELRQDRALFFADEVWTPGQYRIRYLARVVAEGLVTAPPAKIEAMYDPEQYGLSGTQLIGARSGDGSVAGQ